MAALDASDDEFDKYEELEDDFLMIANEGQVAIEEVEEEVKIGENGAGQKKGILKGTEKPFDYNEADHRNRDIQILTGGDESEDEEEKAL